jgi:hypothetical protein
VRKIPTLFLRDDETRRRFVTREVNPVCRWVADGEGVATFKWDGTAVLVDDDGGVWKRREVKAGHTQPAGHRLVEIDEVTGKSIGWVPARFDGPEDRWLAEAVAAHSPPGSLIPAGTYELVGPKVQGNPHGFGDHRLIRHGVTPVLGGVDCRDYEGLVGWMSELGGTITGFEGLVWHHPDGRMAKLKLKDLREAQ